MTILFRFAKKEGRRKRRKVITDDQNISQDLVQKLYTTANSVRMMNIHRIVFSIFSEDNFIFFS
ncbi:MAG: hypothetical protein LHW60_05720 [Candidatus Cloacimonetes bacterium]|nr:hypothetical protein [Candidatus Cloacimonadota bacterium]